MIKKEKWVFVPGDTRFLQLSTWGNLRKLHKSMRHYGIHVYQQQKFNEVKIEFVERKIEQHVIRVPSVRLLLENEPPQICSIAVLMFRCFYGVANLHSNEIVHLDGNELNNNLENLLLVKPSIKFQYMQCFLKAQHLQEVTLIRNQLLSQKISKYNLDGRLQQVYQNLKQVVDSEKISKKELLLSKQLGYLRPINDYVYLPGDGPELVCFEKKYAHQYTYQLEELSSLLFQYSPSGELIQVFKNIEHACLETGFQASKILQSIRFRKMDDDYLWVEV